MLPRDHTDDDIFYRHCIGRQLKFVWLPKTCHVSGKKLWLENAYRETAIFTGPGDPIFENRWYSKVEFLILNLKRLK